jgi:hypothetical protein
MRGSPRASEDGANIDSCDSSVDFIRKSIESERNFLRHLITY